MSNTVSGVVEEPRSLRKELENSNVRAVLLFSFINGASMSIWSMQPYHLMVNRLAGDTTVGWVSAAFGTAQSVSALVASSVSNVRRQAICRLGVFFGIVAVSMSVLGVSMESIKVILVGSALWGVYTGLTFTGTEALLADSVESGKRGFVYNLKWINETTSSCVGYFILLAMTLYLGNDWDTRVLKILMYTGLAIHPTAFLALLGMKDKNTLHFDEKTEDDPDALLSANSQQLGGNNQQTKPLLEAADSLYEEPSRKYRKCLCATASSFYDWLLSVSAVPYLVAGAHLVVYMGSGMTLDYISLYFIKDRHVSPIALFITSIAVNLCIALCSTMVRYLSEHCVDRVSATILVRTLSAVLLMTMGVTDLPLCILLPTYVCRSALMNSTAGVTRSIIMDCVRKESRARWAALECFVSFMWSVSSVVGGYIASEKGYKYTFVITATIHFIAMGMLLPAISGARQLDRRSKNVH